MKKPWWDAIRHTDPRCETGRSYCSLAWLMGWRNECPCACHRTGKPRIAANALDRI